MAKRVEALVKPELLRWAKRTAGLDEVAAAKKADVSVDQLQSWEQGRSRPSIPQLRHLAKVYKRPIAVFYLPEPPQGFSVPKDYRRVSSLASHAPSTELVFQMREAQSRRELFEELYQQTEGPVLPISMTANVQETPEAVATRLREFLDVSVQDQHQWKDPYEGLNGWRTAFEGAGVLVFQMSDVPWEEARGFSVYSEPFPLAVINSKDSPTARIFTMLHELAHLALRQGGICDLAEEALEDTMQDQVEVFCNAVAGATLMPKGAFLQDEIVSSRSSEAEWREADIKKVAIRFTSSNEAAVRRLATLGRVTSQFYQTKRQEYRQRFAARPSKQKPSGPIPPAQRTISSLGRFYSRVVLDNYYQDYITGSDLADLLGLRLKHLSRLEEILGKHEQ